MGFREELTSIGALDTNSTGAAVRIYQDNAAGRGILEFSDGVTGSTPARVALTPTSGGKLTDLRMQGASGGDLGGTTGPTAAGWLSLRVTADRPTTAPGVVFSGVAELGGDRVSLVGPVSVNNPITGPDFGWKALPLSAAWVPWSPAATDLPRYRLDAAGNVHFAGILKLANNGSFINAGNSASVAQLPAGYFPAGRVDRMVPILGTVGNFLGAAWCWLVDGNFVVMNPTTVQATPGYGWALGLTYSTVNP